MEKKKSFNINCAVCDARQVQESTLAAYDAVNINCSALLVNKAAAEVMAKYNVSVNTAQTLDIPGDVRASIINGKAEIHPGQAMPEEKILLIVNGKLDIAPGSEEILKHYLNITVNGTVTCPESMVQLLSTGTINGCVASYPDGCIQLKSTAILDRTFHLRAKQDGHYYASGRVVALSPDINFENLTAKNVRFTTPHLLVAESLAEAAVPLFDDRADITVLPDGCAYVSGDAVLDETLLHRYGGKLYIRGDLMVSQESGPCLEKVSFLQVNGNVLAVKSMAEEFQAMKAVYNGLRIVGGTLVEDREGLLVTRTLLEEAVDGLSVTGCANVTFQDDVSPELIREKLVNIWDCASIYCNQEQRGVLETLVEDVAYLGSMRREKEKNEEEDASLVTAINAIQYVL